MGKMKSNGIPHRDGWHLNTIIHSCFSLHPEDQGSQKYPINYPIKLSHCLSLVCFLYVHIVRPNYPYKIKKIKKTHIWINSKDKKLSSDDAGKDSPCLHCTFIFYFEFCFLGTSVLTNCPMWCSFLMFMALNCLTLDTPFFLILLNTGLKWKICLRFKVCCTYSWKS